MRVISTTEFRWYGVSPVGYAIRIAHRYREVCAEVISGGEGRKLTVSHGSLRRQRYQKPYIEEVIQRDAFHETKKTRMSDCNITKKEDERL